jgi:hypothetical protein
MKINLLKILFITLLFASISYSCSSSSTEIEEETSTTLHAAYADFNEDATTIYLSDSNVVIETTGLPNHDTALDYLVIL